MSDYIYLIAPVAGWLVAQGIKFGLTLRKDGIKWGDAVQSGGMPSSHTAFMVALATVIGEKQGYISVSFAIVAAIAGIIIYDAMGVRRTTGQQTEAINELAKQAKYTLKTEVTVSRGHTPAEVTVGAIVGIIVGLSLLAIV
jgi:uncharacterized protein